MMFGRRRHGRVMDGKPWWIPSFWITTMGAVVADNERCAYKTRLRGHGHLILHNKSIADGMIAHRTASYVGVALSNLAASTWRLPGLCWDGMIIHQFAFNGKHMPIVGDRLNNQRLNIITALHLPNYC